VAALFRRRRSNTLGRHAAGRRRARAAVGLRRGTAGAVVVVRRRTGCWRARSRGLRVRRVLVAGRVAGRGGW